MSIPETVGFYGGKFLPLHQGHVYCITKASCKVDKLYVILSYSRKRDKEICERDGFKYIDFKIRYRWLTMLTKDMENVVVKIVGDDAGIDDYDWEDGAEKIKKCVGSPIDYVFSSEESYFDIFFNLYPESQYVVIDGSRKRYNISATQIRTEGVFRHWGFIPDVVKPYFVKKVVVVGTESTGKSTLVRNLAKVYNTTYVEEYGRTKCNEVGGAESLIPEDYMDIAYQHKVNEYRAIQGANKVVFIDTESTITKYYLELYEDIKENKVLDRMSELNDYDLILYLEPDVEWIDDNTRLHGDSKVRDYNNRKLKIMFSTMDINYREVSGDYPERLEKSIKLIEGLLKEGE